MLTKEEKTALKNQCEKMTKNPQCWENDNFYEPLWNKIARDIKDNNFSLEELTSFATVDKAALNGNNIILQKENIKVRFNTESKALEAKQNNKKYIDIDTFSELLPLIEEGASWEVSAFADIFTELYGQSLP